MGRLIALVAMTIVLVLGARTALAAPAYLTCPYDPEIGELGACQGDKQCDDACFVLFGTMPGGCTDVGGDNCCRCQTK